MRSNCMTPKTYCSLFFNPGEAINIILSTFLFLFRINIGIVSLFVNWHGVIQVRKTSMDENE